MQHDGKAAIYIFILGIRCCSTIQGFTAHTLLRTACGKDVFYENCRECTLIEKKLFLVSQTVDDWSVSADCEGTVLHIN